MVVKFKRFDSRAIAPFKKHEHDAGFDLTACTIDVADNYVQYNTNIGVEIPEGYVGLVFPRSSISDTNLLLANSVGVIDSSYRGAIKCRFKTTHGSRPYEIGDRIAQLIIIPYPQIQFEEVEELSTTERNDGGFGSTNSNG